MSGRSTRLAPRRSCGTASNAANRLPSAASSSMAPCRPTSLDFGGAGGRWSLEKHMRASLVSTPGRGQRERARPGVAFVSDVDALAVQGHRRVDDEVLARGDVVAHQQVEDPLGHLGVLERDPAKGAVARVHRGLGQLVGVPLAEALVALQWLLDLLAALLERA